MKNYPMSSALLSLVGKVARKYASKRSGLPLNQQQLTAILLCSITLEQFNEILEMLQGDVSGMEQNPEDLEQLSLVLKAMEQSDGWMGSDSGNCNGNCPCSAAQKTCSKGCNNR